MKTATARKSFTHSPTGRRLRTGDHVPPTDPHMMGELKANGLVEDVKDASKADTEAAGEDLAIAAMTHCVMEPGDSPRVSIQFRDKREAGFFREQFAAMRASIEERVADRPRPDPRKTTTAPAPTTKPERTPRKTKVEPEPGGAGPGAGGESGAGAGDGSQSDGDDEIVQISETRSLTRGAIIFSAIRLWNEERAEGLAELDRAGFDELTVERQGEMTDDELERLAGLDDEAFAAETMPDGGDGEVEKTETGSVEGQASTGRKPRGNRSA